MYIIKFIILQQNLMSFNTSNQLKLYSTIWTLFTERVAIRRHVLYKKSCTFLYCLVKFIHRVTEQTPPPPTL